MERKPILILIAGGTASGKTTVVDKIIKSFQNKDVSVICMDNYYKQRDELTFEERKRINYDHPDAIDMDLLKMHIRALMDNRNIDCQNNVFYPTDSAAWTCFFGSVEAMKQIHFV